MTTVNKWINPHIAAVSAYVPGKQPQGAGWTKLNTNESPFAPPDSVEAAISHECRLLARYPSPASQPLREAIARRFGLNVNQVVIGNGSDDLLNLLVRAFGGGERCTVQSFPSYSLYPVVTALSGGEIKSVPFAEGFELPVDALLQTRANLLFLTAPNAPTGVGFPLKEIRRLADGLDGVLVIDEAYADFAEEDALPLLKSHGNVLITRTFSKAYGLAGLRVGFAMGPAEIMSVLDKVRDSYNVNRLSQAGALAALAAQDIYDGRIAKIKATRERVRRQLLEWDWTVYPSQANFLFAAPGDPHSEASVAQAEDLFQFLEQHKILVRRFPHDALTAPYLRISIGSDSEMNLFLETVVLWKFQRT